MSAPVEERHAGGQGQCQGSRQHLAERAALGEIRDQRLPIPFSVLKPGQNTLQLEARVPTQRDGVCETVEETSKTVRLLINENSYLDVPDYARIGRYPDIAVLSSGMAMAASGDLDKPVYHFVPNFDPDTLNASASFIAKMAYASGVVQNARFVSVLPAETDSNLIAFGSFDTLPSELTSRLNIDFANIREAEAALPIPRRQRPKPPMPMRPSGPPAGCGNARGSWRPHAGRRHRRRRRGETAIAGTRRGRPDQDGDRPVEGMVLLGPDGACQGHRVDPARYADPLFDQRQVTVYTPPAEATMVVAQESLGPRSVDDRCPKSKSDMIASVDMLTSDKVWNTSAARSRAFRRPDAWSTAASAAPRRSMRRNR